jgi:hypothetical protein
MATPIRIKRSSVPGKVPTVDQLQAGELAVNFYDGKVYIKQDTGNAGIATRVVQVGVAASTGKTIYVNKEGDDEATGLSEGDAFASIQKAISIAQDDDTIRVGAGEYYETCPMTIPKNVTLRGDGIRATMIMPTDVTRTENIFYVDNGVTLSDFTVSRGLYDSSADTGYVFQYNPAGIAITTRSPYLQNITVLNKGSVVGAQDPYGFDSPDNPPVSYLAGRGARFDGQYVNGPNSLEPGVLFNEVTFFTPNAKGLILTNGTRAEYLNSFHYFASDAVTGIAGTVGVGATGTVRLKIVGESGSVGAGDTLIVYNPLGQGIATATIVSNDGTYVRLRGHDVGAGNTQGVGLGTFYVLPDRSAKSVTVVGTTTITQYDKVFGTGSLGFDGADDNAVVLSSASALGFGTGDFTVQGWFKLVSFASTESFIYDNRTSNANTAGSLSIGNTGVIQYNVGVSSIIVGPDPISLDQWYSFAVDRRDSSTVLYLDGIGVGTAADTNDYGSTRPLTIGAKNTQAFSIHGYIDDLEVSNISRYSTGFTTSSSAATGDSATVYLSHFDGADASTTITEDVLVNQDIRTESGLGTATKITLADYKEFGADLRSVGCAIEYGTRGVVGDGNGVSLRLFALNFNHVGTGKDFSNDPTEVIQANEVTELNGAEVSYVSIDQDGNFRVGELFFVDQESGSVSFAATAFDLSSVNDLTVSGGINANNATIGNVVIADNTIETTGGDLTLDPGGENEVVIQGNLNVVGVLTATGIQLDSFSKGNTSVSLIDTGVGSGQIEFFTDGTKAMIIDAGQRIGINSESPTSALSVVGDAVVSGALTVGSFRVNGTLGVGGTSDFEDVVVGQHFRVAGVNTINAGGLIVTGVVTSTLFVGSGAGLTGINPSPVGDDKQLQFNNEGFAGASEFLIYDSATGTTGIGSTQPNEDGGVDGENVRLDVIGIVRASRFVDRDGNDVGGLYKLVNANVGLGTSAPGSGSLVVVSKYLIDTTTGPCTVYLPTVGLQTGHWIEILDQGSSWNINNVTVYSGIGSQFQNQLLNISDGPLYLDAPAQVKLIWSGSLWKVFANPVGI